MPRMSQAEREPQAGPTMEHATQNLLFAILDERPELADELERLIADLGGRRTWSVAAPQVVDIIGEPRVGVLLTIHSAWGTTLPPEIDEADFRDVNAVVDALTELSRREGLEIELELAGDYAGTIKSGEHDRSLATGLLGEWAKVIAGRRASG